jgi:hypothetical protein
MKRVPVPKGVHYDDLRARLELFEIPEHRRAAILTVQVPIYGGVAPLARLWPMRVPPDIIKWLYLRHLKVVVLRHLDLLHRGVNANAGDDQPLWGANLTY